jgi:hypothetical protein
MLIDEAAKWMAAAADRLPIPPPARSMKPELSQEKLLAELTRP